MKININSLKSFTFALITLLVCCSFTQNTIDPLPSWNEGPNKQAIIDFVLATTNKDSPDFVPLAERIATFDQDGTLWVEQPIYTQVKYCLDRIPALVTARPELKELEPFKTILTGNMGVISNLSFKDLQKILLTVLTGMSTEQFHADIKQWLATAKNPKWNRLHSELTYQPMQEVLTYLRANGFKTYIVTGGDQDFVRVYAEQTYGIPVEQVIGTVVEVKYTYDKNHHPIFIRQPTFLLNDNFAGKPEGIHLRIDRRPYAAFGNSIGDEQMLEYTKAGTGARLAMIVLHDDAEREFAYGPAEGLPYSKVGTFTQALYNRAKDSNWKVISMKKDWKHIFSFDQ